MSKHAAMKLTKPYSRDQYSESAEYIGDFDSRDISRMALGTPTVCVICAYKKHITAKNA
jgi:hypothetical protein